jgi:hypothetical protein
MLPNDSTSLPLAAKLSQILTNLPGQLPGNEDELLALMRRLLGQQRILLLPVVKSHGERPAHDGLVCATVELEIVLIDGQTQEHLTGRWIGQAVDSPGDCYRSATQQAMEDFLSTMFLLPLRATPHHDHPVSHIRRRPQGALASSPIAAPAPPEQAPIVEPSEEVVAEQPADEQDAPLVTPPQQLKLLHTPPAVEEPEALIAAAAPVAPPLPDPHAEPPTNAWKAANALWRALVSEVSSADVMAAFESSLERYYSVQSWRLVTPEQIRECCQVLRKRTPIPSDVRLISDREEYILAQLDLIPTGSSMERVERELARLTTAVTDDDAHSRFIALYLHKMHADSLASVSGRALIALARKLRKLDATSRRRFILDALDEDDAHDTKRSA